MKTGFPGNLFFLFSRYQMEQDRYLTIEKESEGIYKSKGSKFLSFAFPVKNENEIKKILDALKKKYHDARHHCYAWILGPSMQSYRTNDDGEPHNSAGKPILGQIHSFKLTNVLVLVVRYFGGIPLGVSGLVTAYRTASSEALGNARIIEKYVYNNYLIRFGYPEMNHIMKITKDMDAETYDPVFEMNCEIKVKVKSSMHEKFIYQLKSCKGTKVEILSVE